MISEVRFRDILSHNSNLNKLEELLGEITGNDIKWTLISKELPLTFDVVGLQYKYCDIVGYDQKNNVYIIELKRKITNPNLIKTEKQVKEYVDLFNENIQYIKDKKPLFYPHLVLKRYFEYANFNYNNINSIIPVIISINDIDELIKEKSSIKCGIIDKNTRKILIDNYIERKYAYFIDTYQKLFSKSSKRFKIKIIIEKVIRRKRIGKTSYFPLVLNKYHMKKTNKSQIRFKYTIIFENIENFKKKYVDVSKYFDNSLGDIKIPELFFQFKSIEIFEEIDKQINSSDKKLNSPRFTIQLFRSGRTNPIIYLEIKEDVYVPLMQIKPVVFSVGPCVNNVIANDMKEHSKEDKNPFYEDVIKFDQGYYEIFPIKNKGVLIYELKLYGDKNNYNFNVYSPKLNSVKDLLPYMTPEKVKKHLNIVIEEKGEEYLFKTSDKGPTEWITSRIRVK